MFDEEILGGGNEHLFQGLVTLINKWKPKEYPNEAGYQKDLYDYLAKAQDKGTIKEGRKIMRENGANKIDIRVDGVGIELKKDLSRLSDVDRAVAQIKRMLQEFSYIIVVLVGKNNARQSVTQFKSEIKSFHNNPNDVMFMGAGKMVKVIEVGRKEITKEDNSLGMPDFKLF